MKIVSRRAWSELFWRLQPSTRARWHVRKRLVFTVTAGRTGTEFLTRLLVGLPGVTAVHEPSPEFTLVMREVQSDPGAAERFWENSKMPSIRRARGSIYIETSHIASKGFFEPLLERNIVPDLILLERVPIATATSHYLVAAVPARTQHGNAFLLRPDDPGVLPLPGWETTDDWSLCYWYCREMERRMAFYEAKICAMGGRVLRTSIDRLKTEPGLFDLVEFVGVGDSDVLVPVLRTQASKVVNSKQDTKAKYVRPLDLDLEKRAREVDARIGLI